MFNKKGFTLIETMVVMLIFSVLALVVGDMVIAGLKNSRYESEEATAVEYARKSMGVITKDIRGANTSERGDYPIITAQPYELTFFNDVNGDNLMERIRYYLAGTNLVREIYLPGPLKDYSVFDASSTVAMYVNNNALPIFTYYNSGLGTTTTINQIRMVDIYLMINVTPYIAPNDFILQSDINLRNLKDY